jgi:hypothetical protein
MREMLAGYPVLGYVFNKADYLDGTTYYGKNYGRNGNRAKGGGGGFPKSSVNYFFNQPGHSML